jgi:hypothetical protein
VINLVKFLFDASVFPLAWAKYGDD